MEAPRGLRDRGGIALAHLLPLLDAPAGRAVAVRRIVGGGLVGERIGADAARQHLGQHFGGIAEQAHGHWLTGSAARAMISSASSMLAAATSRYRVSQALVDALLAALDREHERAGHHRRQRLRAAHSAEARGQDPLAGEIAAEMLAAHLGEGLVGALHDALAADVDPAAGGHLAVHHEPLASRAR